MSKKEIDDEWSEHLNFIDIKLFITFFVIDLEIDAVYKMFMIIDGRLFCVVFFLYT